MAGRPFGPGGPSGLLYGVIVFAILSAVSLGLFILQLTKNKSAENRVQIAEQRVNQYVGRGSPPQYYVDEATARKTNVIAVIADDLSKVAQLVTGGEKDVGATILAKSEQVLADINTRKPNTLAPGDTLLVALTRLSELYMQVQGTADALAAEVKKLREDNASLTARLKIQTDQFESQVASLSTQLNQTQQDKTRAVEQKDAQLRDLQTTLDAREQQLQKMKREGSAVARDKDIEIARLEAMTTDLQGKIRIIKPETFDPNAILTSADGRIMRAIPGSKVVYINLGAKDRIKPGMGFEIFSPTRESGSDLRGKASIEVVTVMEETAECRVTRGTAQPILEGDIVVNIAYERTRKPKFVVRGDFDLNYDGVIDYNGVEEVSSLIRQWGGQVVDTLDESVDFVVIGLPPSASVLASGDNASEVVRDQAQQRDFERSRFHAEIERAQKMFIPVITQNQFLFLTGYAGGTAVVQR